MRSSAAVVRLHDHPPVMLDDVADAITLCATEIRKSPLDWRMISERSGLCYTTIANIGYGDVKQPRMNTVLRILKVMGYRIYASR